MNYRLYALLLTLTLAFSPAVHAMRLRNAALATARSLHRQSLHQTGRKVLARTYAAHNNEHGYRQEEARYAHNANYHIPTAAIAIGAGLTTQQALQEQDDAFSIAKLDLNNIKAVIEILKNCSIKQQEIIITTIANHMNNNIAKYSLSDIYDILEASSKQNQKIIAIAIANNVNEFNSRMLERLLEVSHEQVQEIIITAIINSLNKNINKFDGHEFDGRDFFNILSASKGQNQKIIACAIANDINKNIDKYNGRDLCNILETSNEQNQKVIITAIAKAITQKKLNKLKFKEIIDFSNEQNKQMILHMAIDNFVGQNESNSQSTAHLKNNINSAWHFIAIIIHDPKYKATLQQALNHEKSISDEAAIFYHSQVGPLYWLELLYTKLWEQKYNQKKSNYLFTRFPFDQDEFANAILQIDGQKKRGKILKDGGSSELRSFLFYTNYALFANSTLPGSCSIEYLMHGHSRNPADITTQTIIDKFGDNILFDKYKAEFDQLEKEFKEIVPNSVLLQLAIPHKALNEHVYLAEPDGRKKKLKISGEETDDVNSIIKTLKTNPKAFEETDQQEFCVVMTPDTVHKLREQGAEVRVYGDFDQEKLDALTHKLEALIARIAKENPQTFSGKLTPIQSYQAYKPVLNDLIKKHEKPSDMIPLFQILD